MVAALGVKHGHCRSHAAWAEAVPPGLRCRGQGVGSVSPGLGARAMPPGQGVGGHCRGWHLKGRASGAASLGPVLLGPGRRGQCHWVAGRGARGPRPRLDMQVVEGEQ